MELIVSICRVRSTGDFVLHPMGTFKKYGGYVGINPYRQLPADCDVSQLGSVVIELLEKSGPTGFALSEIEQYRAVNFDKQSESIHKKYFAPVRSTRDSERRFLQCEVWTETKAKSWLIHRFSFDETRRTMTSETDLRIKKSAGPEELGRELLTLLTLPPSGGKKRRA